MVLKKSTENKDSALTPSEGMNTSKRLSGTQEKKRGKGRPKGADGEVTRGGIRK